ncbi:MAG: hypothetical protein RIS08_315 [Actinomycetota bacterium]|jgi:AcrR family transcriptional regulator
MSPVETKERLIDIATKAFSESGFAATSLRSIAKLAGVSPALLVHHFGSRDGLIEQCIMRGLGLWVAEKQGFVDVSLSTALAQWQGAIDKHGPKLQFFRQVLLSGGPAADMLFRRMVQEAEIMIRTEQSKGKMRKTENVADLALIMTLHGLAPLVLQEQVNSYLGGSFQDPVLGGRLAAANLEIYRKGIYKSDKKKKAGKK